MRSPEHFRNVPRPDMPSGEQLVGELRAHASQSSRRMSEVVKPLCASNQVPANWIAQMMRTKCPRPHTVERVRTYIASGKIMTSTPRPRRSDSLSCGRVTNGRARKAPIAHQIVVRAAERPPTPEERSATPSELIRWANEEWPEIAAEVAAYAQESAGTLGAAWQSVITAGLQCLREGD